MAIILNKELISYASDPKIKLLGENYSMESFQPCSYDLRIGSVFIGKEIISADHNDRKWWQKKTGWDINILPSEIVTMLTLEEVNIPDNICATVYAINSFSSIGFLILNPGHIDPGYTGPLSICAINLSKEPIVLKLTDKIFTIIFEKLEENTIPYKNDPNLLKLSRKEREEDFSKKKARKMSISLFELINENAYKPLLKKLIKKTVWKMTLQFLGIIALILTISGGIFELSNHLSRKNSTTPKIDSVKYYKNKLDSLIKKNGTGN